VGLGGNQFNILTAASAPSDLPTIVSLGGSAGTPANLVYGIPGFAPTTFGLNRDHTPTNALTLVNNIDLGRQQTWTIGANATT